MEKKWQITAIVKGDKIHFERINEGLSGIELLGLLDIIRENVLKQMKDEEYPEIEHKAKVIINEDKDKGL